MRNRLDNASIAQPLDGRPSDGETAVPTNGLSKRATPRKLCGCNQIGRAMRNNALSVKLS